MKAFFEFIKTITNNPIFKVSSLNAVSVVVRVLGGLLSSKMVAIFIGPSGLALVGNFRNFLRQAEVFSMLGFENGIIKYIAENEDNAEQQKKVLATVLFSIVTAVLVVGLILLFCASYFNTLFFGNDFSYIWVFRVVAIALPLYVGDLVFINIFNGLSEYKKVIKINIITNITGVLISALLIWQFKVSGALLGLILCPSFVFFYSFYLIKKKLGNLTFLQFNNFDRSIFKGLLSFSLMSLITTAIGPLVALSIRTHLINSYNTTEAGLWEAMTRISFFYLMFVSTLLTVYFFPKLSAAKTDRDTSEVFKSYYKTIIPLFALGLLLVFISKNFIIKILFNEEFLPMNNLFGWQLIGDFFKACSLILGYQFFAKRMTKAFIVSELLSYAILYFSSHYLVNLYGSEGAVMGHAITYFIYYLVLVIYFKKQLFIND